MPVERHVACEVELWAQPTFSTDYKLLRYGIQVRSNFGNCVEC